MNNEDIQFRVFFFYDKSMHPVTGIGFTSKCVSTDDCRESFEYCRLMQFSGFFDKTGRKIFEKDIVIIEGKHWLVELDYGSWIIQRNSEVEKYLLTADYLCDNYGRCEIVGNILQNGEFINELAPE